MSQDYPEGVDASLVEKQRADMEQVLNIEMLSQPPFSLINLPGNLLPLTLSAALEELLSLLDEYNQTP